MTVDKSNLRVRRMFGAIAPKYDRMNHVLSLNVDRYWRGRTVEKVAPVGDAPILDVCTGTGDLALAYWRQCSRKAAIAPIFGVDFCREMLDIAGRKRDRCGAVGQAVFVEADAQSLPFPDNIFQIVCVAFGLRNIADTDRGLAEMARVCKVGGKVAVLEFSMPRRQPLRGLYGWYFRHVLPRVGQWLTNNDEQAYDYLPQSVGEFPSGEALAARLTAAGLQNVSFHPFTFGVATLYIGVKAS